MRGYLERIFFKTHSYWWKKSSSMIVELILASCCLPVSQGPLSAHRGNVEFLVMWLSPLDPLTTWQFTSLKQVREEVSRVSLLARQSLIQHRLLMWMTSHHFYCIQLVRGKSHLPSGGRSHGKLLKNCFPYKLFLNFMSRWRHEEGRITVKEVGC